MRVKRHRKERGREKRQIVKKKEDIGMQMYKDKSGFVFYPHRKLLSMSLSIHLYCADLCPDRERLSNMSSFKI